MRLRPPTPADATAVLEVIVARDVADLGEPDFTAEDLEGDWSAPGWKLASDARVAEDGDGAIIGYGDLRRQGGLVCVHPHHEGRGAGTALLGWLEARGAEQDAPGPLHQPVPERNARARELLERAGWYREWSFWRLAIGLDSPPAVPPSPPGVELREPDLPVDADALHAVSEAAFSALAHHEPKTLEDFAQEILGAHDLDPTLSRVAVAGGSPIGLILVRRWAEERRGYVAILAVDPPHAGRGLGRTLLMSAFAACHAAGLAEATLSTGGHNERALGLYEREGMRRVGRVDRYERS